MGADRVRIGGFTHTNGVPDNGGSGGGVSLSISEESTPLLRKRARTASVVGLPPAVEVTRRCSFGDRNLTPSSTMLDRLLFCYDQRPLKQTGYFLRPTHSSAHLLSDSDATSSDSSSSHGYQSEDDADDLHLELSPDSSIAPAPNRPLNALQRSYTADVIDRTPGIHKGGLCSPLPGVGGDIALTGACYVRLLSDDTPLPKAFDVKCRTAFKNVEKSGSSLSRKYSTNSSIGSPDSVVLYNEVSIAGGYSIKSDVVLNGWPVWVGDKMVIASSYDGRWCFARSVRNVNMNNYLAVSALPHGGVLPNEYSSSWLDKGGTLIQSLSLTLPPTEFLLLTGWASLVIGVTFMSAIGPFASQINVNGYLLGCWIAQAMFVCFLLLSSVNAFTKRKSKGETSIRWLFRWRVKPKTKEIYPHRTSPEAGLGGLPVVLLAGISSGIGSGSWTLSFSLTPIPLAYLFASLAPSVIVFFRLLAPSAGVHPARLEVLGVLIGVLGGVITCVGSLSGSAFGISLMGGNLLAMVCSVTNAICGMCGKYASCISTVVYLTVVCFLSGLTQAVFSAVFVPELSFDTHPTHGVFGWMNPQWHPSFLFVVISFVVGQWGLFFFLQVGTALQQATVMTTQPIIATILGVAVLGTQQTWPSISVIFGGLVTIVGSLCVIIGGQRHEIPSGKR